MVAKVEAAAYLKLGRAPQIDISITQAAIDLARAKDSSHCVIAEALRMYLDNKEANRYGYISVDLQTIRFTDKQKKERYTYLSPRAAQVCVVRWDQGIKPEPFDLRLRGGHTTLSGASTQDKARARECRARWQLKNKQAELEEVSKLAAESKPQKNKAGLRRALGDQGSVNGPSKVLERVGGKPPPVSIGRRREFGIRGLQT